MPTCLAPQTKAEIIKKEQSKIFKKNNWKDVIDKYDDILTITFLIFACLVSLKS